MRTSLCVWLMAVLPALVMGKQVDKTCNKPWTPQQIDNAWIRVPWSHGGHYYHNTLTRADQDEHPNCLSGNCKWKWN